MENSHTSTSPVEVFGQRAVALDSPPPVDDVAFTPERREKTCPPAHSLSHHQRGSPSAHPMHSPGTKPLDSLAEKPLGRWTSIRRIPGRLRNWLASLWRDDPAIAPFLTESFLSEFKDDFLRLLREHQDAAARAEGRSNLSSRLNAGSSETMDRLFDAVVKQRPGIDQLDHPHRAQVLMRLMEHCCLPGSTLM